MRDNKNSIVEIIIKRMKENMVKRNPDRLIWFYEEVTRIHRNYYSDMRFGQFMYAFFLWIQEVKERDPFYVEEADMLDYLHEYVESESVSIAKN